MYIARGYKKVNRFISQYGTYFLIYTSADSVTLLMFLVEINHLDFRT